MKKRFIAGAVCPSCAAMDRLVIFNDNGLMVRECVACGFSDVQNKNQNPAPQELQTRVNVVVEELPQTPELIPLKNLQT